MLETHFTMRLEKPTISLITAAMKRYR